MKSWDDVFELHRAAVTGYAHAADAVHDWDGAPAPGKWSAAEVTEHLILTFRAVISETQGGAPMALRTTRWQRFLLRFTIQRRVLAGGAFPSGAPAPRETRPKVTSGDRTAAIAELLRLGAQLDNALVAARSTNPRRRFRHPYFGYMSMTDAIYVSARHIDHHRAQISGR